MAENNPITRTQAEEEVKSKIQQFLDVYRFLPAEQKAQFQGALDAYLEGQVPRVRELYRALFRAAGNEKDSSETLAELYQSDPGIQTDASATEGTSSSR